MADQRNKTFGWTVLVLHHGVADAWFVRKIPGREGKQRRERLLAFESFDKRFDRPREDGVLRARRDYFFGVVRQDSENLRVIRGRKVRTARAHGNFSFARGAPVAE